MPIRQIVQKHYFCVTRPMRTRQNRRKLILVNSRILENAIYLIICLAKDSKDKQRFSFRNILALFEYRTFFTGRNLSLNLPVEFRLLQPSKRSDLCTRFGPGENYHDLSERAQTFPDANTNHKPQWNPNNDLPAGKSQVCPYTRVSEDITPPPPKHPIHWTG